MKTIYYFSIILFLNSFSLAAQNDLITGLNQPVGLALSGDYLYIAEYGAGKISKINITDQTPIATDVVIGLDGPGSLLLIGDYLYIAEYDGDKISKIDITVPTPTATTVVTVSAPEGLVLSGNELYIAEYDGGKISKIDITDSTPIPNATYVFTANNPQGLELNGNDLYIAFYNDSKISKIDITDAILTATDVVTLDDNGGPSGLALNGNELYIADYINSKIFKINTTDATPTLINVTTSVSDPWHIIINNDVLYIPEFNGNKVSTIGLNTLSVEDPDSAINSINIFPNPATNAIQVKGMFGLQNYIIYNVLGEEIKKGTVSVNNDVDIQSLATGVYFLKFNSGYAFKFLKK